MSRLYLAGISVPLDNPWLKHKTLIHHTEFSKNNIIISVVGNHSYVLYIYIIWGNVKSKILSYFIFCKTEKIKKINRASTHIYAVDIIFCMYRCVSCLRIVACTSVLLNNLISLFIRNVADNIIICIP